MIFLFLGSIIAAMLLYINTVAIMKKIKNGESTEFNTSVGCLLVAFIMYSILFILAR